MHARHTVTLSTMVCLAVVGLTSNPSIEPANDVVARIGTEAVYGSQLESAIGHKLFQLRAQEYELRRGALEEWLGTRLVNRAAESRNITTAKFLEAIENDVPRPSAEELKAALPRYPYEWTDDQMQTALQQERVSARRRALIRELKEAYGVVVTMPIPRNTIPEPSTAPLGAQDAVVPVIIFSDFDCRYSAELVRTLQDLVRAHPKDIRLFLRHAPRSPAGREAAAAALCAHAQGKYWPMVERLFAIQRGESGRLDDLAKQIGLDETAFQMCRQANSIASRVAAEAASARELGVSGTPTTYIAGRQVVGFRPADMLSEMLDEEIARVRNVSVRH